MVKIVCSVRKNVLSVIAIIVSCTVVTSAQNKNDSVKTFNLDQCITYALQHQPAVMETALGVSIAKKNNAINLSSWLPQVNLNGNLTHYYTLPTTLSFNPFNPEGALIQGHAGIANTFIPQISATETILSPDVVYAAKSAHLYVQQAQQANDSSKINLVATVSRAFYDLLLTLEQITVLKEDTTRLAKNLRDTYHQYIGGVVDKTDYKEATISLNNSKAQLKQMNESIAPQYSVLKQLMGFPPDKEFNVNFDTVQMLQQISVDTTQQLQIENRIEYQQLETARQLQQQAIKYYKYQFMPSLSAFYNYNYEYESSSFSNLFVNAYPYSYIGATVSFPLFTGLRRIESIQRAKMQGQQLDWAELSLKSTIYSQYTAALANYKSNLYDLTLMKENVTMAKDVYGVVSLQYKQGVVAYLNVITAESNLMSSEISYLNALFQVSCPEIGLHKKV